jgi:hypothetical protein
MKKVYVVTTGEYSDYSIRAIFSKRELAQEYIDTKKDGSIGEYTLDPIKNTAPIIYIRMTKEGNVEDFWKDDESYTEHKYGFRCFDVSKNLVWSVRTKNEQHATKVVNEKRIQILAHDIWGDDNKSKDVIFIKRTEVKQQ